MRKLNNKRKQKKGKDEEEANDKRGEERKDSKNGGTSDSIPEKKVKKNENDTNSNANTSDEKEIQQSDEEYEVEEVVDQKTQGGAIYYLIKWKGYDSESNTWEPEDTLSCPELIAKFKKGRQQKDKGKDNKTQNKSKMKITKKKSTTEQTTSTTSTTNDPGQEWEVEKIVDVITGKNGARTFRIRWKGYRSKSDTWEPEENLNCGDLIEKFLNKREADSKMPQKELREAPKRTERFVTDTFGRRSSRRNSGRIRTVYYDAE